MDLMNHCAVLRCAALYCAVLYCAPVLCVFVKPFYEFFFVCCILTISSVHRSRLFVHVSLSLSTLTDINNGYIMNGASGAREEPRVAQWCGNGYHRNPWQRLQSPPHRLRGRIRRHMERTHWGTRLIGYCVYRFIVAPCGGWTQQRSDRGSDIHESFSYRLIF